MANEEQLSILKQGVEVWNEWRSKNPRTEIDLAGTSLSEVNLVGAHLLGANLSQSTLNGADLTGAKLMYANLTGARLNTANLTNAWLDRAMLTGTHLRGANLTGAHLSDANLNYAILVDAELVRAKLDTTDLAWANLRRANLLSASLISAQLIGTNLGEANLSLAKSSSTYWIKTNLKDVIGLNEVIHLAPSTLAIETLAISNGKIPENFLRGCGLSDWEIEQAKLYSPELSNHEINRILHKIYDLRATQTLQISPLFISYSHGDTEFVNKLEASLTKRGIRFWRDIHDLKAGRIENQIDTAIRQNRIVTLVLSEISLQSDWVEHEVRTARDIAKETGRDTLCPVALDDSWKSNHWPKRIMEQIKEYNILDFSGWEDNVKFEGMFRKLIDGLELFYKG